MEFRKLNYTTLSLSLSVGSRHEVEEVQGYWTRERFLQIVCRVKEGKKGNWDKKECKEKLLG
jgi:hypothetical protein